MDITAKLKQIDKDSTKAQLKVTAKIYDLHGHGTTRSQIITRQSYNETETEIEGASIEGSAKHKSSQKSLATGSKIKEKTVDVFTFPSNGNGKLLAPLGGSYGYIMGAMKASVARKFGDTSKKTNEAYGAKGNLATGTLIEPQWIEVANNISNDLDKPTEYLIPKRNVFTYFDVIKETLPFSFTITVESELSEDVLLHLLSFIQRVGLGPKRRGIMKIEKVERIIGD